MAKYAVGTLVRFRKPTKGYAQFRVSGVLSPKYELCEFTTRDRFRVISCCEILPNVYLYNLIQVEKQELYFTYDVPTNDHWHATGVLDKALCKVATPLPRKVTV